jgi:signal transduction histidine kinase
VVLAAVLVAGFMLMYRFAAGQIRLTRQQQDFVSAVSHELKTPLTSIRMYGEMLKAGWVDEGKRATYYDYIHGESERLSRLIENVLQLARLTRSTQRFDLKHVGVSELLDVVRSKAATQVERAGFMLDVRNDAGDAAITVDADSFTQIAINLVDNALKFAAAAERRVVVIACRRDNNGTILFTIRDFGLGLALVKQLATAMGGRVDVRNCEPGAEFRLSFPEHGEPSRP